MNKNFAYQLFQKKHCEDMTFEEYLEKLERGLRLAEQDFSSPKNTLDELRCIRLALEYRIKIQVTSVQHLRAALM